MRMLRKMIQYPRLTLDYPDKPMDSSRFIGKPAIDRLKCSRCGDCAAQCPSRSILQDPQRHEYGINLDSCIFCAHCADICPTGAISMTHEFELAVRDRRQLQFAPLTADEAGLPAEQLEITGRRLREQAGKLFGRSLQIREVDSGSCNACDYEINALNNPFNDIERFGIRFVASPRHADLLLVTGAAVRNMEQALLKTYAATPDPKLVVAVGACACSGGIFRDTYAARGGIDSLLPVDVYIPGCPPRPQAILYGLLLALSRVEPKR